MQIIPEALEAEKMARSRCLIAFFVLSVSACTTVPFEGRAVRVTHYLEDVEGCRFLGDVTAHPPFDAPSEGEKAIRSKTALLGGDLVYYKQKQVGTLVGSSFDCSGKYARR